MNSPTASFVLLGVPDEPIDAASSGVDYTTSKCGGRCDPPAPFRRQDVEDAVRCGVCGGGGGGDATTAAPSSARGTMKLVCQIYCPLTGSRFHRTLFIYACVNRGCWNRQGSWVALRAQTACEEAAPEEEAVKAEGGGTDQGMFDLDDDWNDGDDGWSADGGVGGGDGGFNGRGALSSTDDWSSKISADVNSNVALNQSASLNPGRSAPSIPPGFGDSSDDDDGRDSVAPESAMKTTNDDDDDEAAAMDDDVVVDREDEGGRLSRLRSGDIASSNASSTASAASSSTRFFRCFDSFYVACVEEVAASRSTLDLRAEKLLNEYKRREGDPEDEDFLDQMRVSCNVGKGGGGGGGRGRSAGKKTADGVGAGQLEKYEKGVPKHGDFVFQHFVEVLASFPSQILRYSRSGSPLLMSPLPPTIERPTTGTPIPDLVCLHCGAKKIFEMQLLPTLLNFLACDGDDAGGAGVDGGGDVGAGGDGADDSGAGGYDVLIDFGTALVFSCEKSCWNESEPKLMVETVIPQNEPGREFSRKSDFRDF